MPAGPALADAGMTNWGVSGLPSLFYDSLEKRESSAAADLQYTETSLDPRVRGDDVVLRQPRSRE